MPRTRIRLALLTLLFMGVFPLYGQHLASSRFIGLGGATAFADDLSALDWNPAGLSLVHFWDLSGTSFLTNAAAHMTGTFSLAGAVTRFGPDHALAARVSPGMSLDFVVPSTFMLADSATQLIARFDKEISYTERIAAGYAYRVDDRLAVGMSLHLFGEDVKDVRYALDSNSVLVSTSVESNASALVGDLGLRWEPVPAWVVGGVVKNAFTLAKSDLPEELADYRLDRTAYGRFGLGYSGFSRTLVGLDVDTERRLRAGGEYQLLDNVRVQGSLAADASDGVSAEAASAGVSVSFDQFTVGANYLGFFSRESRSGSADLEAFLAAPVHEIEYNP